MSTIIIIISFLAIFHFIYESIILPSIRLHLRNQLFELRDRIRFLKINGLDSADEQVFWFVHDGINNFLTKIPKLTLSKIYTIQSAAENDPSIFKEAEKRFNIIEQSTNNEIKEIFNETNVVLKKAFIANSGAWFLYLIPIAVLIASMKKLSNVVADLILAPQNSSSNIFDSDSAYV